MAALTIEEVKALDFEYLTGDDLLKYCPFPILQKQGSVDDTAIESAVETSYSEVTDLIGVNYDMALELAKTGEDRSKTIVKVLSLAAVRNLTANLPAIPDNLINQFSWLDKTILSIRNGQSSLTKLSKKDDTVNSGAYIVDNEFSTLG
jgi:hypothetical protein